VAAIGCLIGAVIDQLTLLDRRKCPLGVDQVGDYATVLVDVRFAPECVAKLFSRPN